MNERWLGDWRRYVSHGSSVYERKAYTKYVITGIDRDERVKRARGDGYKDENRAQRRNHKLSD